MCFVLQTDYKFRMKLLN